MTDDQFKECREAFEKWLEKDTTPDEDSFRSNYEFIRDKYMALGYFAAWSAHLHNPHPVVSRGAIDINGREVETAVDEAWEKFAIDFLGVDQSSMTYRELVSAGYDIAKSMLTQLPAPQAPQIEGVRQAINILENVRGTFDPEKDQDPFEAYHVVCSRAELALVTLKATK